MLGVTYATKKALKEAVGERLRCIETSIFGQEYRANGTLTVVGPDPFNNRKYYATVVMVEGRIQSVK